MTDVKAINLMMRKFCKKGVKVFENRRCDKRKLGKFLWKLFVLVQFVLPALIKFVAKVPRLGVCGFIQYYSFKRPSRGEAQSREKR